MTRMLELTALRTGELLNVSSLGNELDLRRETVDRYLDVAERLFLLRRLHPWHRNEAKRLTGESTFPLQGNGFAVPLARLWDR